MLFPISWLALTLISKILAFFNAVSKWLRTLQRFHYFFGVSRKSVQNNVQNRGGLRKSEFEYPKNSSQSSFPTDIYRNYLLGAPGLRRRAIPGAGWKDEK